MGFLTFSKHYQMFAALFYQVKRYNPPYFITTALMSELYEPRREKPGFLHMRKQRRRSASR